MPRGVPLDLEPSLLIWARESTGLEPEFVAEKLKVDHARYLAWESGTEKLTISYLEKLSSLFKRPLAAFFLPNPPEESPLPEDFRSLSDQTIQKHSPKTLHTFRKVRRYSSLYEELVSTLNKSIDEFGIRLDVSDSPDGSSLSLRDRLGVTTDQQIIWDNEKTAFLHWKRSIENQGVLVFQITMPMTAGRGFSIYDGNIPIIVLNHRDSPNGKIFSLFHEFAHLLLRRGGICDMEEEGENRVDKRSIEKFCNQFSGAFLIPESDLVQRIETTELNENRSDFDEKLGNLARIYKVSREALLRRLLHLDIVTNRYYRKRHSQWKELAERNLIRRGGSGPRDYAKECIREKGEPYTSIVLDALHVDLINYSDVCDFLELKAKHIPRIEELIRNPTGT